MIMTIDGKYKTDKWTFCDVFFKMFLNTVPPPPPPKPLFHRASNPNPKL